MTNLRYFKLIAESFVDGPGRRAVLFFQGCTLACPGCQNTQLWPAEAGTEIGVVAAARMLYEANPEAITISGGEPFQQVVALGRLLGYYRAYTPKAHVLIYTGYTWEELITNANDRGASAIIDLYNVLERVDVIVDGRFRLDLDHKLMQYRGSANQRPIDVQATLAAAKVEMGFDLYQAPPPPPVVLDWDTPEITVLPGGRLLMPIGLDIFDDAGEATRRCGQTR